MHLNDYKLDLHMYQNRWKQIVERANGNPTESDKDSWHKNFGTRYHDIIDRLLIAKQVCDELYPNNEACFLPPEVNMVHLDKRGQTFREEFLDEVQNLIKTEVREMKEYRHGRDL